MNSWEDLKNAVGQWSAANFGSQKGLGCLAPLLGIAEEAGEWFSAETLEDEDDAVGDICIFLMDYCYRAGVDLSGMPLEGTESLSCLTAALGRLCHLQLKRAQRIRGMEDWDAFEQARYKAVGGLIWELDYLLGPQTNDDNTAFQLACRVWQSVVSKRKWHEVPDKPMTLETVKEDFAGLAGELNRLN
jgi:hypothetical protein